MVLLTQITFHSVTSSKNIQQEKLSTRHYAYWPGPGFEPGSTGSLPPAPKGPGTGPHAFQATLPRPCWYLDLLLVFKGFSLGSFLVV